MTLKIRQARPGDVSTILDFIKELADYEKLAHEVTASESDLKRTLFCGDPKVFALIAERDSAPVGFALYFFNYSTFLGKHGLYLEDLYVRKAERGGGVGKALLSRLAKIALENRCGRMEWAVLDWNEPAIKFYDFLGADAMDEWTVRRLTGKALEDLAAKGQT